MATNFNLTDIDFDTLKTNLKNYLRNKTEFSDLDFEGSGLNYVLDLLAYNSHLSAFYASMIGNEMFLDSAVLRDSVVSRAKLLGYTPRSRRAAEATLALNIKDLDISDVNIYPAAITIPAGTMFIGLGINKTFTFSNRRAAFANKVVITTYEGDKVVYTNAPEDSIHYYYGGGVSNSSPSSCQLTNTVYTNVAPNEAYKNNAIKIISGKGSGQSSLVTSYNSDTQTVEFFPPFNIKPISEGNDASVIEIVPTILLETHEGEPLVYSQESTGLPLIKVKIPNKNVDTNSLSVTVTNQNGTIDVYYPSSTFVSINEDSKVYFTEELEGGYYNICFGDGVLGVVPLQGSIISVSYTVVSAEEPNGIRFFRSTAASYIVDSSGTRWKTGVECVVPAAGGTEVESIESVKYMAPLNYSTQNRALTKIDYETIIANNFGSVEAVSVWGGESNDPPVYGTVFVALKPKSGYYINENYKNLILTHLKKFSMPCIDHELLDPDYIYLIIDSLVTYDHTKTTKSEEQLKSEVINQIYNYGQTSLDNFKLSFRFSQFVNRIDVTDTGIVSNTTNILLKKKIYPILGTIQSWVMDFSNTVDTNYETHTFSNQFIMLNGTTPTTCWIENDPTNDLLETYSGTKVKLNIYKRDDDFNKVLVRESIGYVNIDTGRVELNSFVPDDFYGTSSSSIDISIVPGTYDVNPKKNQIVVIDESDISVNMDPVTE